MNVISYDEQIYLLYFWLRTNLKFVPSLEHIKLELYIEFGITEIEVCEAVHELFQG